MVFPTSFLLLITLFPSHNPSLYTASLFAITMLSFFAFFVSLGFFLFIFSLYTILKSFNPNPQQKKQKFIEFPAPDIDYCVLNTDNNENNQQVNKPDLENLVLPPLVEILPSSNSPKWEYCDDPDDKKFPGPGNKKGKKKRSKKKRTDSNGEEKGQLVSSIPFTKTSSLIQKKIKEQYDQIVKLHQSNSLTLAQVGKFVSSLGETKNGLKHKSEMIKRKFTITKALLLKADRSSFNRLREQLYKLELEEKRLQEDALVYNFLQLELKLSPAYKQLKEFHADYEMKEKSGNLMESIDADLFDISFEELLAQEKKDVFWQKNGRYKPGSG